MKKLLGLLALAVVSNFALADKSQDTLKEFHFSSEYRGSYTDKKNNTGNGLGIAGFRKDNQEKIRWRNAFGGDLQLVDEGNLGLRFDFQNDQDRERNDFNYVTRTNDKGTYSKSQTWENDIALYKDVTLGKWTAAWDLGWKYKSTHGRGAYSGHKGTSNEFYVGPAFGINLLGFNFKGKSQLVYFDQAGGKSADNAWAGNDFRKEKVSGWGANFDLETGGKLLDNAAGNFNYYVNLNNHLRDAKGKLKETGKDAKSTVYLDYVVGANYNTPSLAGIYGLVNLENEWERQTARHGFQNNFSVWTGLGYKKGFDIAVGKLTINPEVKYRVVNKETVKGVYNDGRYYNSNREQYTREYNELRAGIKVGLEVK